MPVPERVHLPRLRLIPPFPFKPNPVEEGKPLRWNAIPSRGPSVNSSARVNVSSFADAILKGKKGGYPAEYKFLWLSNNNYLNQLGNVNNAVKAFDMLEFVLVTEQFMTATVVETSVMQSSKQDSIGLSSQEKPLNQL